MSARLNTVIVSKDGAENGQADAGAASRAPDASKGDIHDTNLTVSAHEQQLSILNQRLFKTDEKLAVFGEALDDLQSAVDNNMAQQAFKTKHSGGQARQGVFGSLDAQGGNMNDLGK